ncbi:hypothetical protein EDB85DRAFT_2156653 [Lactarius pseudohatsudake]|nr:hypothetical protein EDB85DRAFT_2156653 [Lactarius pseudohatsudake]
MAIVDHGNPGAWHGTSMTVPATTVACANDAEVLDGMGALDSHEFRAAGGVKITPKAGPDSLPGAGNSEAQYYSSAMRRSIPTMTRD